MSRSVRVSTEVELEPARAFEVFTRETDRWFRPTLASGWPDSLRFEPRAGGRVLEVRDGEEVRQIGQVLAWEATPRLLFSLELDGTTEVEVRFEPVAAGTRVSLEHRGWDPLVATAGDATLEHYLDRWRDLLGSFESRALEQVLLECAAVFRDAVSAGDAAFLADHMAEDAVLVFADRRYRKPEVVATIGEHAPYEDVEFRAPEVVRVTEDLAILTCHTTGRIAGRHFANFESSAFVRERGAWKLAFHQVTPTGAD